MRVDSVKTFLVDSGAAKHWLFVKIETDEGIHGWGEAYTQLDRDRVIKRQMDELSRYLIGRDPFDIKQFVFSAYSDFAGKRGSVELFCAISGIEQALWDIAGKAAGQPVYNLLGGRTRRRLRVYANGWGGDEDPEELVERAKAVVARGFTALKFDPFPGRWRAYIDRRQEEEAVERVRAVREAVGPEVDILVEVHRRLAPMHAVRAAQAMEPYAPFWFEEPVSARDLDALAEVRHSISLPVVTGEELYTKIEFREVFERRAADILNPDVCNCGGILELREIGAMAEAYHVAMAPHNYNSTTVGLAATLQAAAGMPNFLITEYFVNFEEVGKEIADQPFEVEDSYITLPDRPGLGIDLDEQALSERPYRARPLRNLPLDSGTVNSTG
ncbi:MAG: mandelate racemase/muconate lactonizing enzyme family protein [Caldilineaceae bacterium]|nr:mandelate racemase/muconate lactonizing enzyme family protein [Caldilineaceae bacterium]